jgi:transposase
LPNIEKLAKTQGKTRMSDDAVVSWLENRGYGQPTLIKYGEWLGVLPGYVIEGQVGTVRARCAPIGAEVASSSCGTSRKTVRGRMTKPKQSGAFSGHRFPPEIIAYAVWAYHRFPMSLRDVEDLLAARGVVVSYETIRAWVAKFGLQYAKAICRDRPKVADKWHLDEVVPPINSKAMAAP